MQSKIEMAQALKAAGQDLPADWGKLSTTRAKAYTENALKKSQGVVGAISRGVMGIAAAVASVGAATVQAGAAALELASATEEVAKSFNLGHRNKNSGWRGRRPLYCYPAKDPDPITRQVARQNERRSKKMPIGSSQAKWHDLNEFGKIGPGKPGRRAAA